MIAEMMKRASTAAISSCKVVIHFRILITIFCSISTLTVEASSTGKHFPLSQNKVIANPSNFELLPEGFDSHPGLDANLANVSYSNKIPRIVWVAVVNSSEELPGHLYELFKRNKDWAVRVAGNEEKDVFINRVFAGTRVQWAYNMINPKLGAAKADVWRYATLYTYGGFYIDEDSDMKIPLDRIIQPTDTLIVGEDGTHYYNYFRPDFYLSDNMTFSRHKTSISPFVQRYVTGNYSKTGYPQFFHGMFLVNWAIFTAPRNPVFLRTIENIAEILWKEYIRESAILTYQHTDRFLRLLFATTFPFSISLRQLILENAPGVEPRICRIDFREYGGKCKAISTTKNPGHYRNYMKAFVEIIASHSPFVSAASIVKHYEGWVLMAHAGKKGVFLVKGGEKHPIPDLDTFDAMKFKHDEILFVSDYIFNLIPTGTAMKSLSA